MDAEQRRCIQLMTQTCGTGPPILSSDLMTRSAAVPTMQLSLGMRWEIVDDAVDIGLEVIDEQLTVLTAVLTAGFKL